MYKNDMKNQILHFIIKTKDESKSLKLDTAFVPKTSNFFYELINGNITIPIIKEGIYYVFNWQNLESFESYLNIKNFKHMIKYLQCGKVYNDVGFIYILQYFMLIKNIDYTLDFLVVKLKEKYIRNHIQKVKKFPLQVQLSKYDVLFFNLLKFYVFNIEFNDTKDIELKNKIDTFNESSTFQELYNINLRNAYIHLTFYSYVLETIKPYNINNKNYLYIMTKLLKNIIDDEALDSITKKDRLADYYKKLNKTSKIDVFSLINKYNMDIYSINYLQYLELMHFLSEKLINYKEKHMTNILPYNIKTIKYNNKFSMNIHEILLFNDWKNILLAGGSVLSFFMFNDITNVNDFDLFFYNMQDETQIHNKISYILHLYEDKEDIRFIKSEHAISILYKYRKKTIKIQIILRMYSTKEEILYGFDVDSSCIGYDGKYFVFID